MKVTMYGQAPVENAIVRAWGKDWLIEKVTQVPGIHTYDVEMSEWV